MREPYYEANDYIDGLKTAVEDSCEEGFGIPYYPTKNFQEVYSIINQNLAGVMMDGVPASDVVGIIQSMGDAVIQSAQ